ncbi:MAG: aldo/keto reductase, partial [Alphaproteobacteria bacterium]|nr:aldo/keto reductase [Alphaproteobacteria bacterium]
MDIRSFTARNGTVLPFSVIGFGTAPLGDLFELLDEKNCISTIQEAYAGSVTIYDTSPHYGNGLSEVRLGTGLRRADRKKILISTKIGR